MKSVTKLSPYMNINRIEFIVTYHCSGKCIHCSVSDKLNQANGYHHVRVAEAAQAIEWLAGHFPISSVMTFGGEPLLYPDVVCSIHKTASSCGIEAKQLITNGYFSKDEKRIQEVANLLYDSGVNNLMLSVDAFHQETIPVEPVYKFAETIAQTGLSKIRLQPAWLVNPEHENPYNKKTREILSVFQNLGIPVAKGNNIFLAGNAAKYLSNYYDAPNLNLSDTCGTLPYTELLTNITSLSIVPNGDVMICSFVIGNIYQESIADIISRYDPYENDCMRAIVTGGASALIELAAEKGISIDCSTCYSICDLCHKINAQKDLA